MQACIENVSLDEDSFQNNILSFLSFEPEKTESGVIQIIQGAKSSIEVSLYGLENEAIIEALRRAKDERGVRVRMSSSLDQEGGRGWQEAVKAGLPVRFGNRNGIMHNKYFIIDRKLILTGSTNLTSGLSQHFNHTLIIRSPDLALEYLKDFEIQFAGYYANKKDEGYSRLYGGDIVRGVKWNPQRHFVFPDAYIQAYFTPYTNTFPEYTENITNAPECKNTCITPPPRTSSIVECEDQLCEQEACYIKGKGLVYTFLNYDEANKLYCATYDNAMNVVSRLVSRAKKSILVLAFAFRDRLFMHELIKAKQERNVDVRIYIDDQQYRAGIASNRNSFIAVAEKTGFLKISFKPEAALLHHKALVIDGETVLLGSLNFSQNAVKNNDENFVIIENHPSLAQAFYSEAARIDSVSHFLYPSEGDDKE